MGSRPDERGKRPGPWWRVILLLIAVFAIARGAGILAAGEYVHRDRTLATGTPARLVGAAVVAFGAFLLVRTVWPWARGR